MKSFDKLNQLTEQEIKELKGGIIPNDDITFYGADMNLRGGCSCTGNGDNVNGANKCQCSDATHCMQQPSIG